jgi:hypothetical protein
MPRWTTDLNDAAARVARLQSKVGDESIRYVLGAGGFNPDDNDLVSPHYHSKIVGRATSQGSSALRRRPSTSTPTRLSRTLADSRGDLRG